MSTRCLPAIAQLFMAERDCGEGSFDTVRALHNQLLNVYQRSPSVAKQICEITGAMLRDGLSSLSVGRAEAQLGANESALSHFEDAIVILKTEKNQRGLAHTLRALGDLERKLGQHDAARGHYEESISMHRIERDRLGEANTLRALGELETRVDDYESARACYVDAIPLFEAEQEHLGLAGTLRAFGYLEAQLGRLGVAREFFDRAVALCKKEKSRIGLANVYQCQGDTWLADARPEKALALYRSALEIYLNEQDPTGAAYTLAETCRCMSLMEEFSEQELRDTAQHALIQAGMSNAEPVMRYVLSALLDVCGEDRDKLMEFVMDLTS